MLRVEHCWFHDFGNWTLNQLPGISRISQVLKLSLTMTVTYTLMLFVTSVLESKTIKFFLKQFYFLNNWQVTWMTIIKKLSISNEKCLLSFWWSPKSDFNPSRTFKIRHFHRTLIKCSFIGYHHGSSDGLMMRKVQLTIWNGRSFGWNFEFWDF